MSYKVVVYVPHDYADAVRDAIASAGGGTLGKYTHCTFTSMGVGRSKPMEGANPHIGTIGQIEAISEERIEVTCDENVVGNVVAAIKRIHPYEEIAMDVYLLTDW